MVHSSLCLSHILVLTGYRIVIRYALVIFNFRLAISNRIFWRNFLEHERKIFEHSWTNHELRVIQLKKPTARKKSSSSFFRLLKIGVKTNGETNFKHLNIGHVLNLTRFWIYRRYSLIALIFGLQWCWWQSFVRGLSKAALLWWQFQSVGGRINMLMTFFVMLVTFLI